MAQTSYIDITPELATSYYANLQPGDRFQYARIRVKNTLQSVKTKKGISKRSLLPEISIAWAGLSGAEQLAWKNAAVECGKSGWNLFVQDFCARRVNGLSGLATPSLLHQSWVGRIKISAPATSCNLVQIHPAFYYVMHKVAGKKSMYEPVKVVEKIAFPFTLSANYSANLNIVGANPYAKIYAELWYSYQGVDRLAYLELDIPLDSDWGNLSAVATGILGIPVRYDLHIELNDVQGDLYVDNIEAIHSGQNWVRDPYTDDLNQGFTRNFYQIPKNWAAVSAPDGVEFESVYKDF